MKFNEIIDEKYELDDVCIDIPLNKSKYCDDQALELAFKVQELIKNGVQPRTVTVRPSILLATQDYLDPSGFSDPVLFKEYRDKPVVLKFNGAFHIIDGHLKVSRANRVREDIEVYLFSFT